MVKMFIVPKECEFYSRPNVIIQQIKRTVKNCHLHRGIPEVSWGLKMERLYQNNGISIGTRTGQSQGGRISRRIPGEPLLLLS